MKLSLRGWPIILVFLAVLVVPSYSGLRGSALKVQTVGIPGLTKENTRFAFADDGYALVAPYAPSQKRKTIGPEDIEKLDNNNIYVVDTQNAKAEPRKIGLGNLYYPTSVVIDEAHETAVVAGTILDTVRDKETGQELVQVSAGIALAHLHTIDHKVEATAQPVILRIPGRDGTETTPDAPGAIFLGGSRGGFVVFSNGASVYSVSIADGALSELEVIPGDEYSPNNYVSVVAVDKDSSVVVLSQNLIEKNRDGDAIQKTSLLFYSLKDDGSFSAWKMTDSGGFPEGTFLSEGSQVAIATDDSGN
ncbi:MAG TPA: hypothetical protein VGV87_01750, partial [Blastocatellia bacterium]|nr:hypothetical protein [Blastocatellia bacterium]